MKRSRFIPHATAVVCVFAGTVLAGILFTGVPAQADIDVHISIGDAPPAPHFLFQARPRERFLPGQGVYVVDDPRVGDNDCFRYGGYYWVFRDGYWYRASSWRRHFVVVQPRYVPAVFYRLPPAHWKHRPSGPPGLERKGGGGPPGHARSGDHRQDQRGGRGRK
jgi:hypothetical protein